MMSLPFLLFACGLGAAWLRQRGAAMGFWVAGLVTLLVLFRMHMSDVVNVALWGWGSAGAERPVEAA
jgi:hypothetical protein